LLEAWADVHLAVMLHLIVGIYLTIIYIYIYTYIWLCVRCCFELGIYLGSIFMRIIYMSIFLYKYRTIRRVMKVPYSGRQM